MTSKKLVDRHTESVFHLRDFLKEVVKSPHLFAAQDALFASLKSQGALAKYVSESRGIIPSSINTLKRICDKCLDGGFPEIDRLRLAASEAIANAIAQSIKSNKRTKIGLSKRVEELEVENRELRQDLLLLTMAFEQSLAQAAVYARRTEKQAVIALCKREQRELLDKLTLRVHPIATNVVKIRDE